MTDLTTDALCASGGVAEMTDTRELVDELRLIGCHANGDARCTCGIGQDAADTITALVERRRAMEEALQDMVDLYDSDEGTRSLPQVVAARAALASGGRV